MTKRNLQIGNNPLPSKSEDFFKEVLTITSESYNRRRMYGSSASFCPRQNYLYSFKGEGTNTFSAESTLYMEIGLGVENAFVRGLRKKDRLFYTNLELPTSDPSIGGRIDLVYLDQDEKIAIAEIKTCGANLPKKPKLEHQSQLLTYAAIAGYNTARLVYVSRTVQGKGQELLMRVFEQDLSHETFNKTFYNIVLSQYAIDKNLLPNIPSGFRKTTTCRFCPFNSFCWGGEEKKENWESEYEVQKELSNEVIRLSRTKPDRYISSLKFLYRTVKSVNLKNRLKLELENGDKN